MVGGILVHKDVNEQETTWVQPFGNIAHELLIAEDK
jgi:hypothetical protein